MSQNLEKAYSRLNNIQTVEPLLGALRTMSMGAWQMANNKIARMKQYENNFHQILAEVLPYIKNYQGQSRTQEPPEPNLTSTILLFIGSERGLCGKFNESLVDKATNWINTQAFASYQIWALGARMVKALKKKERKISWQKPLPSGDSANYHQAYLFTQRLLTQFENFDFNNFFLCFNSLNRGNSYQFTAHRLIPFTINKIDQTSTDKTENWPPSIIDSDPYGIYNQIVQHFIASSYYQSFLSSAAAEHATRFALMQEAKTNAEEIIEDLGFVINAERKKKITQQMQELAVGAGLLDY